MSQHENGAPEPAPRLHDGRVRRLGHAARGARLPSRPRARRGERERRGRRRRARRRPPRSRAPRDPRVVAAGGRARVDPRAHAGADHARRLRRGVAPARRGARRGRRRRPARFRSSRTTSCSRSARPRTRRGAATAAAAARARSSPSSRRRAGPARPSSRRTSRRRSRSSRGRRRCCVDLDLQFGDAAIMLGVEPEKTIFDLVVAPGELDSEKLAGLHDAPSVRARDPAGAAAPGGRRARDGGEARTAARGGPRVVRRDRRRHVAVLPRADAGDARPHRRAVPALRPRRSDAEERQALAADARAALVPARPDPDRPQPRQLEGRDEAERGRGRARHEARATRCRPTAPCRSA